jgi:hypothetical protein
LQTTVGKSVSGHSHLCSTCRLLEKPKALLAGTSHAVFSGPLEDFKRIICLATQYEFSVGLVPMAEQKRLFRCYNLPGQPEATIDLALRSNGQMIGC